MLLRIATTSMMLLTLAAATSPVPGKSDDKVGRQQIQRGGYRPQGNDQKPVAPAPVEKVEDPEYQAPCDKTTDEERSDLCAQWTAAKGARQVALLTWPQLLLTVLGTAGLLVSLYQTRKGLKAAVDGVRLAKQGIDAARQANSIADEGLKAAAEANERSAEANAIAARSNEIAVENLRIFAKDFDERMRPRCVVIGITLIDKWQEVVEAGNPLPMTLTVQNMGGATGRHLLVQIDRIVFHDRAGKPIARHRQLLRLAPLRAGQVRPEGMLITVTTDRREVHGITVEGRIGSMGDRLDDAAAELTMVEEFSWRENPLHRASRDLVERAPGDDRDGGEQGPEGLPSSAPALG